MPAESRPVLETRYLQLTRETLPAKASAVGDWPVRFDHCFMRICLDHAFGGCWYDYVDRSKGPAYRIVPEDALQQAVEVARRIETGGRAALVPLNEQSLRWRGKL